MRTIFVIISFVAMVVCVWQATKQIDAENTVKPPLVEFTATTAREEIVTGVCTFGDCPVATTACTTETTVYELGKVEEAVGPVRETYTLTEWDGYDDMQPDYGATYTANEFCDLGEIYWGGWRWTWYSEKVLPGGGLDIPGRHTEGGYVRDGDGYICLASDALDYGTVIATPFGSYGLVYDCGCDYDTIDVYVSW